jgi:hypothetical protein
VLRKRAGLHWFYDASPGPGFRTEPVTRALVGMVFRVGDKVTQLRNNYDKGKAGIFNGTVGVVTDVSLEEQALTVLTDEDEQVDYDFAELDELAHAYAVTIHRSEGSEYPAVVIPLTTSSWLMLQRNLLYTGVTRARKLLILAGSRRALAEAIRTPGAGRRHTASPTGSPRLGSTPAPTPPLSREEAPSSTCQRDPMRARVPSDDLRSTLALWAHNASIWRCPSGNPSRQVGEQNGGS